MINRCTAIAAAGLSVVVFSAIGPTTSFAQEAATVTGRVTNSQGQPEAARTVGGPTAQSGGQTRLDPVGANSSTSADESIAYTIQACAARRGQVVTHEGVQQCRLPAVAPSPGNPSPGASPPRNTPNGLNSTAVGDATVANSIGDLSTASDEDFAPINRVNTVQACTARRGQVVRRDGVQQCRLPAVAPSPGNPGPGASPPRN